MTGAGPRQKAAPEPGVTHETDPAEPAGAGDLSAEAEIEAATDRPDSAGPASEDAGGPEDAASSDAEDDDGPEDAPSSDAEDAEGPEETGASDAEEAPEPDPLADAERQRDEYLAMAQRTQADFENYRKRAAKEAAAAGARAKAGLVRELLPVMDNLERALASAGDRELGLSEGIRLVHAELAGVLQRSGIESYEPAGEPFDPTLHEALSTRTVDGTEPGVVLDVIEKGYKLNETIIRPARVVVSG